MGLLVRGDRRIDPALDSGELLHDELVERLRPWVKKLAKFAEWGYEPHYYQLIGHTSTARFLVLGSGRRGGKTRSAAWEFVYRTHPVLGREALRTIGNNVKADNDYLVGVLVTPDHKNYDRTRRDLLTALKAVYGRGGYQYNKNDMQIGVPDLQDPDLIIYLKSAEVPESLQGDGYDVVWIDEAGSIGGREGWDIMEPSLAQTRGCVILSTTPGRGDNNWWFYEMFVDPEALAKDHTIEYVSWYSIDNPYFPKDEWQRVLKKSPWPIFKREYMASWDRPDGGALKLDWLEQHAYTERDLHYKNGKLDPERYDVFVGVDPAYTNTKTSDYFCLWVMARDRSTGICYLVDWVHERLLWPDQLDAIKNINRKYRPIIIGVESNNAQRNLVHAVAALPGMPPVTGILSKGKKEERLQSIGPYLKEGLVRAPSTDPAQPGGGRFREFFEEVAAFPKGRHDDTLDALDITIKAAADFSPDPFFEEPDEDSPEWEDWSRDATAVASTPAYGDDTHFDLHLGSDLW